MKPSDATLARIAEERRSTRTPWHRLEPGQIRRLLEAHADGIPREVIAKRFNVSRETVTIIVRRERAA